MILLRSYRGAWRVWFLGHVAVAAYTYAVHIRHDISREYEKRANVDDASNLNSRRNVNYLGADLFAFHIGSFSWIGGGRRGVARTWHAIKNADEHNCTVLARKCTRQPVHFYVV
jgi:hypothetical protein